MFILAHNICCSFPTRIDIQHHVHQFRHDPQEEDGGPPTHTVDSTAGGIRGI